MSTELVSLSEAARRLEYSRGALSKLVRREQLTTTRSGTQRLVSWTLLVELVAEHSRAVSLAQIATTLGVTRQRLTRHLRREGMLCGVRRGCSAAFSREDVDRVVRYWRRRAS